MTRSTLFRWAMAGAVAGCCTGLAVPGFSAGAAWAAGRGADAASVEYTAAAAAPIMQITEDEPTSTFHPEGEGDFGYTLVTANPSSATALAAVAWPGAAAGNAGTLVSLLGGPTVSALNDPVQASAATGTTQTHSSITAPTGSEMSASVDPLGPNDQHTTATSALAGSSLGPAGGFGNSTSTSTIDFNAATGVLSATASSQASGISVDGVVKIGSVTSTATGTSTGGGNPVLTGSTDFQDMTVAGEPAYVDGSGVHLGTPASPAGPAETAAVDAALAHAGMEVYFTSPHSITVGGVSYYYAASLLFYWAPPSDPSNNSFTMTLGGSGISMTASSTPGAGDYVPPASNAPLSSGGAPPSPGSATPAVAPPAVPVGTVGSAGGTPVLAPTSTGRTTMSLPASPSAAVNPTPAGTPAPAQPAAVTLPGPLGAGWWVLLVLTGLAGAGLTTRLPVLLDRRAAGRCPRRSGAGLDTAKEHT